MNIYPASKSYKKHVHTSYKKDTWETGNSMFTQVQDIVIIFVPIHRVKTDGHLKINTESYTFCGEQCALCTCCGLVNKENTPFIQ
jgi:hypothetical protein